MKKILAALLLFVLPLTASAAAYPVGVGGTGSTTLSGILKGNGTSAIQTAVGGTDYEFPLTFGDGLTRILNDIDCDTASGSVFGCLSSADWTTFNNKQNAISLTTTGTSGAATFDGTTLNIPNYTSSGGGSGNVATSSTETTNRIPFWTSTGATPATLSGGIANFTFDGINLFSIPSGGIYQVGGLNLGIASTTNGATIFGFGSGGDAATTTGTVRGTTAFGRSVFAGTTGVTGNTGVGYQAGQFATSSPFNTYIGYQSGRSASGGDTVSSIGLNVGVGYQTLTALTTGYRNTAVGASALDAMTTGVGNTAVGWNSLGANTTGTQNTALGQSSLSANTTGNSNMAIGFDALGTTVTGSANTAVGYQALLNDVSATSSTALGYRAGRGATGTSGQGSVFVGYNTGFNYTAGADYNTCVGYQACYNVTSGANNIMLGGILSSANSNVTTGSNNIYIGYNGQLPSATASGQLNIQNIIYGTGNTGTGATLSTGNIGIGTTTPFTKFGVGGDAYIGGNLTATGTVAFTALSTGLVKSTSGTLSIATAGTDYENPLTFSYPLQRTTNTISLAFGTTTANAWSGLQSFTNVGTTTFAGGVQAVTGHFTGLLHAASTALFSGLVDFAASIRLAAGNYINFGATSGSSGYGFRDNSGTIEYKNSGGAWSSLGGAATATSTISGGPASTVSTQTITHGLGRTPVTIFTNSICNFASNSSARPWATSNGSYSAAGNRAVYISGQSGTASVSPVGTTTISIFLADPASGAEAYGVIQNVGATTFDVRWYGNNAGSLASTCQFIWTAQ